MKKTLIITIALITFISCSKDEDQVKVDPAKSEKPNPIINTWHLISQDNKSVSDCTKKTTFIFTKDKKFTRKGFTFNQNGECVADGEVKGKWSLTSDGKYTLIKQDSENSIKITVDFKDDIASMQYKDGARNITEKWKKGTFNYVSKAPIIGVWNIYSENGKVITNECEKKGFYDFKENNNFSLHNFYIDGTDKTCKPGKITAGTWVKNASNKYTLKGKGEEDLPITAVFSDDNKTLMMTINPEYSIVVKKK